MRILQWHKPPPQLTFGVTDSLGLLVCAESAINGAEGTALWAGMDRPTFKANALRWIEPRVKGNRNHPSLVIWSAEKALGGFFQALAPAGRSRATINHHHPQGCEKVPEGSICSSEERVFELTAEEAGGEYALTLG